jgi:hypothetical protein
MSFTTDHRRTPKIELPTSPDLQNNTPEAETSPSPQPEAGQQKVVRVMAYLTEEEGDLLDRTWLQLRRMPTRPSKSDVLRAALTLAASRPEELGAALSQQRVSTLSRQRGIK